MKAKTLSAAKKRIRFTATGKVKTMKGSRKHLLQQKSKKQKSMGKRGKMHEMSASFRHHLKKAMPGS